MNIFKVIKNGFRKKLILSTRHKVKFVLDTDDGGWVFIAPVGTDVDLGYREITKEEALECIREGCYVTLYPGLIASNVLIKD